MRADELGLCNDEFVERVLALVEAASAADKAAEATSDKRQKEDSAGDQALQVVADRRRQEARAASQAAQTGADRLAEEGQPADAERRRSALQRRNKTMTATSKAAQSVAASDAPAPVKAAKRATQMARRREADVVYRAAIAEDEELTEDAPPAA